MRHDAERMSAAYLGQELRGRARARFEWHLLECGECRAEVDEGRRGRAAAESLRLVTPSALRDRVRATVEVSPELDGPAPAGRRHRRWATPLAGLAAASVAGLVGLTVVVAAEEDRPPAPAVIAEPAALSAIAAVFRGGGTGWTASTATPPTTVLDGMRWSGSRQGMAGDLLVLAHRYAGEPGHEVLVVESARPFPRPDGAHAMPGANWVADVDGVTVVCLPAARPALVVGSDPLHVTAAADALAGR